MMLILAQVAGLFESSALAWGGLAAATAPILIHLLTRLRRRQEPWAAMRFVYEVFRKQRSRLRLEQLLLLAVRCLILIVLGLALAGPLIGGWARQLGVDPRGRTLIVIIDDSLTSQVRDGDQAARLDELKATARQWIDALGPGDRVAVWRAGRPSERLVYPPTESLAQAKQAIDALQPGYATSDVGKALEDVAGVLRDGPARGSDVSALLLSDWSRNVLPRDGQAASFDGRATLFMSRPARPVGNVQVAGIASREPIVLWPVDERARTIALRLELRRFVDVDREQTTDVTLALRRSPEADPLAAVTRTIAWQPGQTEATTDATITLDNWPGDTGVNSDTGDATALIATATLSTTDSLVADNARSAVIELRRRYHVGVIAGEPIDQARPLAGSPTAAQWLAFAATLPGSGLALQPLSPERIEQQDASLTHLDACVVLRPDLLMDAHWQALASFVQRGGALWITPPAQGDNATWTSLARRRLAPDWKLAVEPSEADEPQPLHDGEQAPAALSRLTVDWQALLRPVRVTRWLAVQGEFDSEPPLLVMQDGAPLLLSTQRGDGRLIMFAAALDENWTNLPTKPLWVPLLHETLRGALARPEAKSRLNALVVGQTVALPRAWEGATRLRRATTLNADATSPSQPVALRRTDTGFESVNPLRQPGVYRVEPATRLDWLAVNVGARGGDTAAASEAAIEAWLQPIANRQWLDPGQSAAALQTTESRASIGWPLLWVVLALVLLEMVLARLFSHARVPGPGLVGLFVRRILRGSGK